MKKLFLLSTVIFILFPGCGKMVEERYEKDRYSQEHGLERTAYVYSMTGELLKTYEGKFDIDPTSDSDRIKFDLDGNQRIMIYNATVIIEEKAGTYRPESKE